MASSRKYPKWTPERRQKFMATVKAKTAHRKRRFRSGRATVELPGRAPAKVNTTRDAIVFLRQARDAVMERIRDRELKSPDPAHLLALQALNILEGA